MLFVFHLNSKILNILVKCHRKFLPISPIFKVTAKMVYLFSKAKTNKKYLRMVYDVNALTNLLAPICYYYYWMLNLNIYEIYLTFQ